jgi:hypothetical protein
MDSRIASAAEGVRAGAAAADGAGGGSVCAIATVAINTHNHLIDCHIG